MNFKRIIVSLHLGESHVCTPPRKPGKSEETLLGNICHCHDWKSQFQYFAELGETRETNYAKGKVTGDGEEILR